jgi:prolyl oligopeptidase
LLYGYGGFDIALTPQFNTAVVAWLELGGVYVVANLRGGGEYGRAWHEAGRRERKQNVFDDFVAVAEHLVATGVTTRERLAIWGHSNGGLLVGAVMTQRPDLVAAAVPAVGVHDLLRYHTWTIGWAWADEYGTADDPALFEVLMRYSPLHNARPARYPATLVMTADHDDRVVPAHSFKFGAALQHAQQGDAPILLRIESRAGHGASKPLGKVIDEYADLFAFLVAVLGVDRA